MYRKPLYIIILIAFLLPSLQLMAQKGKSKGKSAPACDIVFNVEGAKDTSLCLTIMYNGKYIIKDTAIRVAPGVFHSKKAEPLQEGFYTLVSNKSKPYLTFIMPANQRFTASMDTTGNVNKISFKNSPENAEMLRFQHKASASQKKLAEYRKQLTAQKDNQDSVDFYTAKIKELNEEMQSFILDLIERNPNYLFSKMQRVGREIKLPEPDTSNPEFLPAYYRQHYWDNIDLTDSRLIFTPVFEPKMKDYFGHVLQYQDVDTINKYVDMVLERTSADSLMYRYCVDWVSRYYETSKYIGHDGVFVHIVKNNQLQGKCTWMDETLLKKYAKRISHIEPLLIGTPAVELIIPDTTQSSDMRTWISSHRLPKEYTILWFFDPDCPKCNKQTALLKQLYDSLEAAGIRNFDVYAIGNDSDVERWKKYVRDKKLPWYNVGGNRGNVDYLNIYNIYESGNPSMFIINRRKEIILNRSIEIMAIPEFLKQYEAIQKKKAAQAKKD